MSKADIKQINWSLVVALIIAGLVVLSAILLAVFKPHSRKTNGIEQLSFSQGERLHGYVVYAPDGKELDISEVSTTDALLIFGMAGCRDCIADFPVYRLLYALYNREDFPVLFIWDNEIPQRDLDDLGIPPEASYTVRGLYKFTDWVPSYYFIDENSVIINQTVEIEEAVSLLPDVEVPSEAVNHVSGSLPILVGLETCGSCKQAYEGLTSESVDFLYFLEGTEGEAFEDNPNIYGDPYKILSRALSLDMYPVYIYVDDSGALVIDDTI